MKPASAILNTDRINYLNIALMLASCVVALFVPFALFLFAYAVLGPAHYLTEISWLHKRNFFTRGEHDYWLLGGLALALFIASPIFSGSFNQADHFYTLAEFTLLALGAALVFMLTAKLSHRIVGLAAVLAISLVSMNVSLFFTMLVAVFVPTLLHVYVFTGFFMIYGALKDRSRSGYLAFLIFLLCPVACLLLGPAPYIPGKYVLESYFKHFAVLNQAMLGIDPPRTVDELGNAVNHVFLSRAGVIAMRFIAFAYTYHYLNWFSKTSIIRWHQVSLRRLSVIGGLWLAAVGLYAYNYTLGFKVLFCLSFMHLYLEFPLNHLSIIGTFKELRSMASGATPRVAAAHAGAGKR
jgi:hypothetical protein